MVVDSIAVVWLVSDLKALMALLEVINTVVDSLQGHLRRVDKKISSYMVEKSPNSWNKHYKLPLKRKIWIIQKAPRHHPMAKHSLNIKLSNTHTHTHKNHHHVKMAPWLQNKKTSELEVCVINSSSWPNMSAGDPGESSEWLWLMKALNWWHLAWPEDRTFFIGTHNI